MDLNLRPLDVFLVLRYHLASVAQLVEHQSGNQKVPGSNLRQGNELIITSTTLFSCFVDIFISVFLS